MHQYRPFLPLILVNHRYPNLEKEINDFFLDHIEKFQYVPNNLVDHDLHENHDHHSDRVDQVVLEHS